jgi:hypothetical protein
LGLVQACHEALATEFPDYELLAVKQKWAELAFQAFPVPWAGPESWTHDERNRVDQILEPFREQSTHTCEQCGGSGELRTVAGYETVMCDGCLIE